MEKPKNSSKPVGKKLGGFLSGEISSRLRDPLGAEPSEDPEKWADGLQKAAERYSLPRRVKELEEKLKAEARATPEPKRSGGFMHSQDYRSVTLRGETYSLTDRQAQVIEILHEAHTNGTPEVGTALVLERLETPNSRLRDTFRTNPSARKALIAPGQRKGTLRLNL